MEPSRGLPLGERVIQVALGAHHALLLTDRQQVYSFLCDDPRPRKRYPQLGQGRDEPQRNLPKPVQLSQQEESAPGDEAAVKEETSKEAKETQRVSLRASAISAGQNHSVASSATHGDTVFVFGSHKYGRLAHELDASASYPFVVPYSSTSLRITLQS
uniref:Uncharacterized protein n=2 Tax=Chrysotila carterae TaxID=13221 RepID=A0A7S4BLB8_CHRCT